MTLFTANPMQEYKKLWRLATGPLRFLPDFIVVGAPKCGTSSLFDGIRLHPQFATSIPKEPTNFIHYPTSRLRSQMHFPFRLPWKGSMIAGEASVEYFTHPDTPRNIHFVRPQAKLIFMMRDPLKRAWSDYKMFRKGNYESREFGPIVEDSLRWLSEPRDWPLVESSLRNSDSPVRYVYAGDYLTNIERWLKFFPREQCLFLLSEDFFADSQKVLDEVFAFVGLPPREVGAIPHARDGGYKESMDVETETRLREYFTPRNARLSAFLGRTLPWSC